MTWVDKLLAAWRLQQDRINYHIPSYTNRLHAARNVLRGWPR